MPRTEKCRECAGAGGFQGAVDWVPCSTCKGNGYVPAANPHNLYKTGDADAPEVIKDRNSEVVLGLCRDCGKGEIELDGPCVDRSTRSVEDPLPEHHGTNDWEDIDLTDDKPVPGRMANQTWRILEEQRQAAEENIREAEAEIERWSKKMVDATITKRMCEAGQASLVGNT